MLALLYILLSGLLVGGALGLTGSGGSLFAIPLLLTVVGLSMEDAVPLSLLVIGATALLGAVNAFKTGLLLSRPTLIFGIAGIVFTPLGFALGAITPETMRVLSFAILALALSVRMAWQSFKPHASVVRADVEVGSDMGVCRLSPQGKVAFSLPCAAALGVSGACVGVLSGFFGVGGGFLIVPALMLVIRLQMPYAVASSLAIIAMISLAGGAVGGIPVLLAEPATILFGIGSLMGMMVGRAASSRIAGPLLQRVFAVALFLTGLAMVFEQVA